MEQNDIQVPTTFSIKKSSKNKQQIPISYLKRSCPFNNQAILVCSNPNCSLPGLLCSQNGCKCITGRQQIRIKQLNQMNWNAQNNNQHVRIRSTKEGHRKCKITYLQSLVQKIEQKRKKAQIHPLIEQNIQKIESNLTKLIQQLSLYRDALQIYFQNYGLSEQQYKLVELLKNGDDQHITGKLISLVKQKILLEKLEPPQLIMQHQREFFKFKKQILAKIGICFSWFKHFCSSPDQIMTFGKQKQLILKAKQNKWQEIVNWIESGKRAIDMIQLNLYSRGITKVPKQISLFRSVSKINLFNNKITTMEHFQQLRNLTSLDLKKNQIQKIANIEKLGITKLYLNQNQITRIQNIPETIVQLGLDKNRIFKIQNLEHCQQLELLGLTNNNIQYIQGIIQLSALKQIRLDKNPVKGRVDKFQQQQVTLVEKLVKKAVKIDILK